MLNCSTCHKKKPTEHFYAYPTHRAHVPSSPTPDDSEALARLLADGLLDATTARQTPTASRATLAHARERLATSGRPVESEAQRRRRELAQRRAVEREAEDARQAEEDAALTRRVMWGAGIGTLALVGALMWNAWRAGVVA